LSSREEFFPDPSAICQTAIRPVQGRKKGWETHHPASSNQLPGMTVAPMADA
jgi:hypothetical protein